MLITTHPGIRAYMEAARHYRRVNPCDSLKCECSTGAEVRWARNEARSLLAPLLAARASERNRWGIAPKEAS